jgi:hypothetical protein
MDYTCLGRDARKLEASGGTILDGTAAGRRMEILGPAAHLVVLGTSMMR